MSQSRGYHPSGNSDFKSCCDFKHLVLTNKSADTHCKKETNSVWVDKSNCRFIYLYVFYRTVFHRLWASQWTLKSLIMPALVEVLWGPWEIFHLWAEYFSCNINACHQMQNQSRNHNYTGLEVDMVCCLNLLPSTVAPFFFKCMAHFKYSWISHRLPRGYIR